MKQYNDVAQGKDNKYVDARINRSASNNVFSNLSTHIEDNDDSPEIRARLNKPNWEEGTYQPHCEEEAEDLLDLLKDDDIFIPGLDDLNGPTDNDLSAIESEE